MPAWNGFASVPNQGGDSDLRETEIVIRLIPAQGDHLGSAAAGEGELPDDVCRHAVGVVLGCRSEHVPEDVVFRLARPPGADVVFRSLDPVGWVHLDDAGFYSIGEDAAEQPYGTGGCLVWIRRALSPTFVKALQLEGGNSKARPPAGIAYPSAGQRASVSFVDRQCRSLGWWDGTVHSRCRVPRRLAVKGEEPEGRAMWHPQHLGGINIQPGSALHCQHTVRANCRRNVPPHQLFCCRIVCAAV